MMKITALLSPLRLRPFILRCFLTLSVCLAFAADIASAQITANITRQPLQTRAGSPITSNSTSNQPVVVNLVHTGNSTAVAGATVTVTLNTGSFTGNSTTNATTDAGGNATFSNLVLTQAAAGYTLTFSANISGTTVNATSAQFPIIAAAASNATLTVNLGNATYGSPLTPAATVQLTDTYGNPVSNTNITASLNGTATFLQSNTTVRTDTGGNATFLNLRPAQVGNFTVTFATAAAGVGNVTSNVTVSPLATTITIGNATINATASFPPPGFSVSSGPTPSAVAFSQNASAILGSFTYTTNNSTAVGNHSLGITPGVDGTSANYTITYSNGTLTVTPAIPTNFTPIAAPVTTEAGRPIEGVNLNSSAPQSPTFRVQDEFGNPVPGITVNATLSTNPTGATLNGTTSVPTDSTGNATFNNLIITKAGEGYVLHFSTPTLGPITTDPFNIEPGAAGNITVTTQPGNATAGEFIPGSPAVQVVDLYSNPVNSSYNIQATLLNGTFTGNSITAVPTNSTGYGIFPSLSTNQSGTYQIQFAALAAGNITSTSANFTIIPDFASANISVAIQPGNSTAGVAIAGPPTARILDQYGNAIPNYSVGASPTPGSFINSTTTNTTDGNGNATFSNLRLGIAGNYTLRFSFSQNGASGNATTSTFTVNPAAPAKLVMVTEPSSTAQAGIAFATQPAVRLQDEFNNNVSQNGTSVSASASGTGNGTAGGNTTATTDGNGTATFSGLSINGTIGNYTLTFNSTGLSSVNATTTIALSAGTATQLGVSTQPSSTAMANATFSQQPVVQIRDAWGNIVLSNNSTVVSATLNTGGLSGNLSGTANAMASGGNSSFSGLAITGQAGNYTLTFNATGFTSSTSSNITITPDLTTANLSVVVQPGNSTAGDPIPGPPTARIVDQFQNGISNYTVNATLNSASFTSNSTRSVTTGGDGNATFSNLVSNTAGTFTIGFVFTANTTTTASNSTTSSSFTVNPDIADKLVMVSQPPTTARAGVAFDNPNAPQVRLQDQFNNNVLQNGTVVTVSVGGNATLGGGNTTATTDPTGTAIFPGLSIGATVGNYSLTFSNGSLTPATSNAVLITPGLPNKLSVTSQPTTAAANATLSPQPSVNVLDTWNNLVTSDNSTVSASLNAGSLNATLNGTTTANASSGNATFSNLRIRGQVGNYTLTFTSGNLSNATTSNITITPDLTSASISIASNATNSIAGELIQGAPAARIVDQFSNPIAGYTVNATLNTGNFTANSTTGNSTGANGTAVFANLRTNTSGNYTLRFSFSQNGASGNATTSSFTVNAATAAALAITTQPSSSAQAGFALVQQPVIQVRDAFGNNKSDPGLVITATASGTGNATVAGNITATTNGNGSATFSGLRLDGTAGIYNLTFSNGTLTTAPSGSITLGAGTVTKLAVTTQPVSTAAGSAFNPQPVVRLQDAWSNNVTQSGTLVTAVASGTGNGTVGGNITATTTNGTATFNGLTIAGQVGNYSLTFNASSLTPATSNTFAITANPATAVISIGTNATTSVAGQTIQGPPSARIVDGSGNPLSGFTVNAALQTGNFTANSTTVNATGANGTAVFANLRTNTSGNYTLRFSFSQNGASGNATTANFTVTAATVANMTIAIQPKSGIAGLAIPGVGTDTFPVVQLRDAFNNLAASQNITASLVGGNFALGSNTTVSTDSGGNATFNNLVINTAATGYQIAFSGPNGTSSNSTLFNIAANSVSKLNLTNSLQSVVPFGVALDPQPVIQLADAYNNPVRLANYTITASASTGNLSAGSIAATNANGTATFSGLAMTGPLGNRTLVFSSGALENATSSPINLVAGPPASMTITVQPATSFNAGDTLRNENYTPGSGPVVRVLDADGNPVASTSINATGLGFAAFGTGSNTTISTDVGGNATFSNLIVVKSGSGLQVNFTSGNLSAATTGFNVEALPASSINITQQPPSVVFQNAVISANPSVTLLDLYGNPTSTPGTVSVALNGGTFASGNTTVSTISGVGIFTNLVIGTIGNYTLTFNATGVSPATSSPFSVISPAATGLNITSISGSGGGNYTISFSATQGGTYWIQRTTDLKLGLWTYVSANASTAITGNNTTSVTTPGGTKAFWRLTTQRP